MISPASPKPDALPSEGAPKGENVGTGGGNHLAAPTGSQYPPDWPAIAKRIKDAAGWVCERCKHPHEVATGYVLTVHHLDGNKSNCADWNLAALCQRCHLTIQGRVKMEQGFMEAILPVSEWFRPHLAGYLASLSANTDYTK